MPRKIIQLMGYANDMNGDAKYALCDDGTVWSWQELRLPGRDGLVDLRWGWKQVDTSDITSESSPDGSPENAT